MNLEDEYLRLSDVELKLENSKRQLDDRLRKVRIEMDTIKAKIIEEYLEDGVVPFNLTIKKVPPGIIVTDESKIPVEYKKTKTEIDKKKLNKACKTDLVAGTAKTNGGWTVAIGEIKNAK